MTALLAPRGRTSTSVSRLSRGDIHNPDQWVCGLGLPREQTVSLSGLGPQKLDPDSCSEWMSLLDFS